MTGPALSPTMTRSKGKAQRCNAVIAALLEPGERLLALADVTSATPTSIGLAVTDRRLIAVPKAPRHPAILQAYRQYVDGVRFDKRLMFTYLVVTSGGEELDFGIALGEERTFLEPFLSYFTAPTEPIPTPTEPKFAPTEPIPSPTEPEQGISLVKKTVVPPMPPPPPHGGPTIADELIKLADLHQRGLLNDEEFQTAKAAVIKRRS